MQVAFLKFLIWQTLVIVAIFVAFPKTCAWREVEISDLETFQVREHPRAKSSSRM